jgi:hypothetical protein
MLQSMNPATAAFGKWFLSDQALHPAAAAAAVATRSGNADRAAEVRNPTVSYMLLRLFPLWSYSFFQRSGLPKEVLARVWDLANSQRAGGQMCQQYLLTACC